MKLLLTSGGISNDSIAQGLFDLVGKRPEETSLVFIPTASNVEMGDKSWFIDDLVNLKKHNFKSIDIADISAVEEKIWRPKLEEADILYFEGGNTYHLMNWINKSGLVNFLPEMLKEKIYVGSSAGSMVAGQGLSLIISQIVYDRSFDEPTDFPCLNFTDFYFLPHLNSSDLNNRNEDFLKKALKDVAGKIYALDDDSALKVVDGKVEVISEGKWLLIN